MSARLSLLRFQLSAAKFPQACAVPLQRSPQNPERFFLDPRCAAIAHGSLDQALLLVDQIFPFLNVSFGLLQLGFSRTFVGGVLANTPLGDGGVRTDARDLAGPEPHLDIRAIDELLCFGDCRPVVRAGKDFSPNDLVVGSENVRTIVMHDPLRLFGRRERGHYLGFEALSASGAAGRSQPLMVFCIK